MKTIAIIITIAGVVGAGWLVYDRNKDSDNQSATELTQNQNSENDAATNPSEDGEYLVIQEWGVRFELPENLQGKVVYGIQKPKDSAEEEYASFEIDQLTQLAGNNCALFQEPDGSGESGGSGVQLMRTTADASESENILSDAEYDYSSIMPKGSCLTDQSNAQLEIDLTTALNSALKNLEVNP